MIKCDHNVCTFPTCDCTIDRISADRFTISRQYRIGLRKMLIEEIKKAAELRDSTDKQIAAQIGFTPQAYSRLIHREGYVCSVDSLLLYLARLGVGVHLSFHDLETVRRIKTGNPLAHKTQEPPQWPLSKEGAR